METEIIYVNKKVLNFVINYRYYTTAANSKKNSKQETRTLTLTRYNGTSLISDKMLTIMEDNNTQRRTDVIIFCSYQNDNYDVDEYDYFGQLSVLKDVNLFVDSIELDGKIIYDAIYSNKLNNIIMKKLDVLINMFDKLKFNETLQIKIALLQIKTTYIETGQIMKNDMKWMNDVYMEYKL